MASSTQTVFMLAGATATGKTATAQLLAEHVGCGILSADAMLVYTGMDIGTAKPTPAERGNVPYAGIDLVTPAEPFSTGQWLKAAAEALHTVGHVPASRHPAAAPADPSLIVVGGTGLYIKALTDGIQSTAVAPDIRLRWQTLYEQEGIDGLQAALRKRAPEALGALVDTSNPRRLLRALEHLEDNGALPDQWKKTAPSNASVVVLSLPREQLHRRIATRVDQMFRAGFLEEVRLLRTLYPTWSATAKKAIGYEEACAILDNALTLDAAREKIIIRTRQLAKRQETWLRHQTQAHWLMLTEQDTPQVIAERVFTLWRNHGPTTIHIPG